MKRTPTPLLRSWLTGATVLFAACAGPNSSLDTGTADETTGGEYMPPSPECDPLAQDCGLEEACYFVGGDRGFACETPAESPGAFGDPCQFPSNCGPGLDCGPAEVTPGCAQGFGCCTPYCEVDGDPCPAGLSCNALFDGGAPPGYEKVGLCSTVG
jgi:hypothetical protein